MPAWVVMPADRAILKFVFGRDKEELEGEVFREKDIICPEALPDLKIAVQKIFPA